MWNLSIDFPIGLVVELFVVVSLITFLIKRKFSGYQNVIGALLLAWMLFMVLELLNPMALNRIAWFYAVRGVIIFVFFYLIFFSAITKKRHIYIIFELLIGIGFIASLYALYQNYIGVPAYELRWVNINEDRILTFYAWGRLRLFSIYADPKDFGLIASFITVICLFFALNKKVDFLLKGISLFISVICFWAMIYSGLRTALFVLIIGIGIYMFIEFKKYMILIGLALIIAIPVFYFISNRVSAFHIMRTAFDFEDDPSFNVRLNNQKTIRTYILKAPIGYGLGSTGTWGAKFPSGHFVSGFPPDSEYVRIGIENGYLGLFFWCLILGFVFSQGVRAYFKINDVSDRNLLAISLSVFFMFVITFYTQESLRTYALISLFSLMIAIISKFVSNELTE